MNIAEWQALSKQERRLLWQQWDNVQRLQMYHQLAAITPGYSLPYPDDYNDPADSPLAFRELANATDAALGGLQTNINAKADKAYVDSGLAGKAPTSHTHSVTQVGFRMGRFGAGSIPGGEHVTKTVAHGLGKTPTIALGTAYRDTGDQSGIVSVDTWDSVNVVWKIGNLNNSASETLDVCWLVA